MLRGFGCGNPTTTRSLVSARARQTLPGFYQTLRIISVQPTTAMSTILPLWGLLLLVLVGLPVDSEGAGSLSMPPNQVTHHISEGGGLRKCQLSYRDGRIGGMKRGDTCQLSSPVQSISLVIHSPLSVDLYGPVLVECSNCSSWVFTRPLCDPNGDVTLPLEGYCRARDHPLFTALVVVLTTISLLLLFSLRYLYIRYHWAPKGKILMISTGSLKNFVQRYSDGRTNPLLDGGASVGNRQQVDPSTSCLSSRRFKGWRLFLAIVLVLSNPNRFMVDALTEELHLTEGDIWRNRDGVVEVKKARLICPLSELYHTFEWESTLNSQYWCTWAACDANGPCVDYLPMGNWTTSALWYYDKDDSDLWAFKRYCSQPGPGCPFISGCWKWDQRLRVKRANRTPVYGIATCRSWVEIVERSTSNFSVGSSILDLLPLSGPVSVVMLNGQQPYICRTNSNKGAPKAGALGDLQVVSGDNFALASDSLYCTCTPGWGPKCQVISPFLGQLSDVCLSLPAKIGGLIVEIIDNHLSFRQESSLIVTVETPHKGSTVDNNETCSVGSQTIYGTHLGPFPLVMMIQTDPISSGTVRLQATNCLPESIELSCSQSHHYVEIPNSPECLSMVPEAQKFIHEERSATFTTVKLEHGETSYTDSRTVWDLFQSGGVAKWLIGHSVANVLLFTVVLVLFCRR